MTWVIAFRRAMMRKSPVAIVAKETATANVSGAKRNERSVTAKTMATDFPKPTSGSSSRTVRAFRIA